MIRNNTPVETYPVQDRTVWVKREDLCTPEPGPPFSKCRGLYPFMQRLRDEKGINVVGYVETPISMAGWGVAWCAEMLGMKAVIFEPQYKDGPPPMLRKHKRKWKGFNVDILPVRAGRTSINHHVSKKVLAQKYKACFMLPIGIPSIETVIETAAEWRRTVAIEGVFDHTIICVGSGTICAGILKDIRPKEGQLWGVLCCHKEMKRKTTSIYRKAGVAEGPLFGKEGQFHLIDPGWEYTDKPNRCKPPFPCHRYYDQKAWVWLVDNLHHLQGRVLFWNIGHE